MRRIGRRSAVHGMAAAMGALLLAACSTHVSRDISAEGVAGQVIFPPAASAYLKEGTYPSPCNVRTVVPGLNKDQIYKLLGPPHFSEGFYRVREWDYLFHFKTAEGERTCQFKIIYDHAYLSRSLHWQPAACARLIEEPRMAAVSIAAPPATGSPFLLEADGLFAFSRSGIDDLSDVGRQRLSALVAELEGAWDLQAVDVLAYTDQIGSDAANLALSQQRAESVRNFLIAKGIPAASVRAVGMGSVEPVVQCDQTMTRADRIACLSPNRRVEVRAIGRRD